MQFTLNINYFKKINCSISSHVTYIRLHLLQLPRSTKQNPQYSNLYSLYTADLPAPSEVITATFTDDTALLSSHEDSQISIYVSVMVPQMAI